MSVVSMIQTTLWAIPLWSPPAQMGDTSAPIEWNENEKSLYDTEVLHMLYKVKLASALLTLSVKSHCILLLYCYMVYPTFFSVSFPFFVVVTIALILPFFFFLLLFLFSDWCF